jgi:hypothetical protein
MGDEVRARPTASVSDWLLSVAEVLPLPHRAVPPYTLGEAVAELGAYAQAVGAADWNRFSSKKNRASLCEEIAAQSVTLGRRLAAVVTSALDDLVDDSDSEAVVAAATRFHDLWHSEMALTDAFYDLCDAAKTTGTTSRALRNLSAIIISQVGPAGHGAFSLLNRAADALVNTEEDLIRWRDSHLPDPLTEADRLEMATKLLVSAPAGRIVVWTVYYRATIWGMREVAGPMTFLRADWALPNAFDIETHDFPERAELQGMREGVSWLNEVHVESLKAEYRLVLVRVDLGERQLAGAEEEARRRVDAVLSVAVEAGGTSWRNTDAAAVLIDGNVRSSSLGLRLREAPDLKGDSYGMGATAEILRSTADQLGDALAKGPMPDRLVEALTSIREARTTDHRDVLFYGARRVRPRVATALEDHAMELIASVIQVRSEKLAEALQRREALDQASRAIANQLMAPFIGSLSREHHERRQELEREISEYSSQGIRLVSVSKVVALQARVRALPMSDLQRSDLEDALAICTDPHREERFLEQMWRETGILRARHRRVRNAVNHGLPLHETALNSIRNYSDNTSSAALNMAITWFKDGGAGATLLDQEESAWGDRQDRIGRGLSWAAADALIEDNT